MPIGRSTVAISVACLLSSGALPAMSQDHDTKGHGAGGAAHWDYANPVNWGKGDAKDQDVNKACVLGKNQTPIDIVPSTGSNASGLRALNIAYEGKKAQIKNNGHTIQVDYVVKHEGESWPKQKSGQTLKTDDGIFDLKQFHFHTPSENRIGGVSYAMEGHFVHYSDAGVPAVLAVMFEVSSTPNSQLSPIWRNLPASNQVPAVDVTFNPADLFPGKVARGYFSFKGSLTTPPCSETVLWYVLKAPVTISQEQVDAFKATLPRIAGLKDVTNARPLQPLKERVIKEFVQ
jgi:carbonic anhydrase